MTHLLITLLDSENCYTFKLKKSPSLLELKQAILLYVNCIDCLETITIDKLRLTFDGILIVDTNYYLLRNLDKINVQVYDKRALFPFYVAKPITNIINNNNMETDGYDVHNLHSNNNINVMSDDNNDNNDKNTALDNDFISNISNINNDLNSNKLLLKRKYSMIAAVQNYFKQSALNQSKR